MHHLPIQNCISCDSSFTCNACAEPFALRFGICIRCANTDCLTCEANNFCTECSGVLAVSAEGYRCILCQIPNCFRYDLDLTCFACKPGFFPNLDETACVNCLPPNCKACNGDNVCSRCAPGYILSNNICVFSTCKFPYLECDPTNSSRCASCVSLPFVLTPNNGVCLAATPQLPGLCHSQHLCLPQLPGRLLAYQWPLYSLLPKSPVLELLQLHDLHYLCCRIPHPTRIWRPMHPGCSWHR